MLSDFKFAIRQLTRSPGFTTIAVLTLALGIGASTAIFSVVHALLLAPLQYGDAAQLVQVQSRHQEQGLSGVAPATFGDLAAGNASFVNLAAQYYYYVNLTGTDAPALLNSAEVTADYFKLFAVVPLRGRTWSSADLKPGATPVAVLGHALWRGQFNSSDAIIGRQIMLDEVAHTVIGVMPASFKDPSDIAQLWRPMRAGADDLLDRSSRYWTVFARLQPGLPLARANAELVTVARRLASAHPGDYAGWTLQAADLRRVVVGDYRSGLLIVLGAVGCVMLITCANIAGLSIVRALARRKELAIRAALGSSRFQLIRQLLTENLLLAMLGGSLGVLFASWGVDALLGSLPQGWLPRAGEIALNRPVLGTTLALTLVTGLASGLAPGFAASRIDTHEPLKDSALGSAGGAAARRLRAGLIVVEIALALVLLAGAGLLGRSFAGLMRKDPGLDAGRVLTLTVSLPEKRYGGPVRCWDFFSRAEARLATIPGVEAAGFTHTSPFRWGIPTGFAPVNPDNSTLAADLPPAFTDSVTVDYFKALGIPLRAGRIFNFADDHRAPPRVILSETAARRYFDTKNPLGRFITTDGKARFEVVGVVGDVHRSGLTAEIPLQVYRPFSQRTPAFATLMVRTSLPPSTLARTVQAALWEIDPDVPVSDVSTMEMYVSRSVMQPRLHLMLFGLFAAFALLLAGLGLYGLVSHGVGQRTREFGVRTALGASPRAVLMLVLREGAALIGLGVAVGLTGALVAARLLQSMIFETSLYDPTVFLAVPLLLAAVGLLACWLPARRATKVDPMVALRSE
jgi:putative ABC transport system permease protein